eukprot:CAMPEP_0182452156 /NCGR_PEP_ID=MMETSP1172-20130603/44099_1 /TAXON_ID=708627 /ORGANISM="Timspurckia oligopyrenoides, Strain CCMP3278" /LENGTH=194 /DNA_ID=CAMNT_0024649973 /DNA_START=1250 /DNA_END=1834 /DNA_ORIENTATION=+
MKAGLRNQISKRWSGSLGFSMPAAKQLKQVCKLPLLEKSSTGQIKTIWSEYHKDHQYAIGDIIKSSEADSLLNHARKWPMFVFPVRKEGGYFTLVSQWQRNHCLMTYLEDYKLNPNAAQPWCIFSLYNELAETKGITLIRAEVFLSKMSKDDGEQLLRLVKRFYLGDKKHTDLLHTFAKEPKHFDFQKLIALCA